MRRYEPKPWDIRRCDMTHADEGEYVLYCDAQTEIERLTKERDEARAQVAFNLTTVLAGSSEAAWQDVTALPDPKEGPFMVSNLPNAVNSHGRPSHVFCVRSIHKDEDGSFCAFDGYRKIWGITRYYPISSPALPHETTNDQ